MTTSAPGQLHVITGPAETERWLALVADVAALVRMEPIIEPRQPEGAGGAQAVLAAAAGMEGAVLVLPAAPTGLGGAEGPPRLERLLVPFDRSRAEDQVLRPLIRRALEQDVAVEQVHVLTEKSRPRMWEGPGHHAAAWHDELRRRHRVGTATLAVRSGQPAVVLAELGVRADLVAACWDGQVTAGRAKVLRAILASALPPPLLLLRRPSPRSGGGHR
ncbi:MAG TPA: hypothetical protein VMB82_07050 [Acidimicrobiales bacterium]|nr:hypothetical protein [Acidimicrobiales bacterium]